MFASFITFHPSIYLNIHEATPHVDWLAPRGPPSSKQEATVVPEAAASFGHHLDAFLRAGKEGEHLERCVGGSLSSAPFWTNGHSLTEQNEGGLGKNF